MKGLKVLILLAMFLSLAWESSYGQSAWILWTKETEFSNKDMTRKESWNFDAAYPTYEGCIRAKVNRCLSGVKFWKGVEAKSREEFEKKYPRGEDGLRPLPDPGSGEKFIDFPICVWGFYSEDPREGDCEEYTILGFTRGDKLLSYSFECFPETFDPRK